MTEETTLNPAIHAAFRRDLRRLDAAFDAYDPAGRQRAEQLVRAWGNFSYQLHRHHQDEELFFWPAFRTLGVDPAIVDELNGEHDVMVMALSSAEDAMETFAGEASSANAKAARIAIADLADVLVAHLDHEQRTLDPFSVEHKRTKQHKAAEHAARKAHTEGAGMFFAWLTDGCDADTAIIIRREVPPPILWLLTHVGGRRYNQQIASIWG